MVLALSSVRKISNNINFIFDNDKKKLIIFFQPLELKFLNLQKNFLNQTLNQFHVFNLVKKKI